MFASSFPCLGRSRFSLGRYSIVPLRYEDRFLIMRWRNAQIYHLRQARPLTEEDQERYFGTAIAKMYQVKERPEQLLFSYLRDGECIGYGGLVHINWLNRNAEVSFIMDTKLEADEFALHWTNWLTLLRAIAFGQLGLHKIYTYAFDLRPHLYPVLESAGFVKEAVLKEHCLFEGQYKDVVIHSLWPYTVKNYKECSRGELLEVLELRNRPEIRSLMVNQAPIAVEDHFRFVEGLSGRKDRRYFAVYSHDGGLAGTYNLSDEGGGKWDRGIVSAQPGKGRTAWWEFQLLGMMGNEVNALTAIVKPDNLASVRYHQKIGFREVGRDPDYIHYILPLDE